MALGRQGAVQDALLIGWHEVPSAPGHVFYDRLNGLLDEAGFDRAVEALCQPHYASGGGRPSIPPGRYFRMLLVGYFEGLDSERGIAWCCADSLSLQRFLKLGPGEAVPDRSTLARTRARLPLEVHDAVFALVLGLLAERGLIKGRRVGIDASTMEANAAMRSIVRRGRCQRRQAMLGEPARTSGIATPTTDQLRQFDRARKGQAGLEQRPGQPDRPRGADHAAQGRPHLAGLQAGARGRSGQRGDPRGRDPSRRCRRQPDPRGYARGGSGKPCCARPRAGARRSEVVADKGYHTREVLKRLADGPWTTRIAEPALYQWAASSGS